jgi:hypothetical protein
LGVASLLLAPVRPAVPLVLEEEEEPPALPPDGALGSVVLLVSELPLLEFLSEPPQPKSSWLPASSPAAPRKRLVEKRGQSVERVIFFRFMVK